MCIKYCIIPKLIALQEFRLYAAAIISICPKIKRKILLQTRRLLWCLAIYTTFLGWYTYCTRTHIYNKNAFIYVFIIIIHCEQPWPIPIKKYSEYSMRSMYYYSVYIYFVIIIILTTLNNNNKRKYTKKVLYCMCCAFIHAIKIHAVLLPKIVYVDIRKIFRGNKNTAQAHVVFGWK